MTAIGMPTRNDVSRRDAGGALERRRRRHPSDLVRVVAGLIVLSLASLPVRPDAVGRVEAGAFGTVNGLPDWLFWPLWPAMQLGSLVAVGLVALAALAWRRWWLAVEAGIAGTLGWTVAKLVKDSFARPRPGGLLEEVAFRGGEPIGFGFVSGHTTVAFALATAASLYVPRRWRPRLFALAALVGLTRVFVGAHLPLDVVGGAALGWGVAAAVRLVIGAATGRPSEAEVGAALRRHGFPVTAVTGLSNRAGTSAVFDVVLDNGRDVVAKVLSDRPQDQDVLYRWWLRLTAWRHGDSRPFASPRLQVEHEATRMLLAARAGVRVPAVLYAGQLDPGHAVLLTERCPGRPLAELPAPSGGVVAAVREQVDRLHAAGVAHGKLYADNVVVEPGADGNPRVTLVDFGSATLEPDQAALAADQSALDRLVP